MRRVITFITGPGESARIRGESWCVAGGAGSRPGLGKAAGSSLEALLNGASSRRPNRVPRTRSRARGG